MGRSYRVPSKSKDTARSRVCREYFSGCLCSFTLGHHHVDTHNSVDYRKRPCAGHGNRDVCTYQNAASESGCCRWRSPFPAQSRLRRTILPNKGLGPVAQLVEQGTENPCVGGSNPPWATFVDFGVCAGRLLAAALGRCPVWLLPRRVLGLLVLILPCGGCGADVCETLCSRTSVEISNCIDDWSATWEDLGADRRSDFKKQCEDDWAATRADLEPLEVRLALDECDQALDQLNKDITCDELRMLYLE